MRRMRIKQAHPKFTFDPLNIAKQTSESGSLRRVNRLTRSRFLPPQIHPVIGRILADQINLAHAFADESPNFCNDRLRSPAAVFSPHLRNHAKTARMITTLRDLYVSEMGWRKPKAGRVVIGNVSRSGVRECKIDLVAFRRNIQRRTSDAQRPTVRLRR